MPTTDTIDATPAPSYAPDFVAPKGASPKPKVDAVPDAADGHDPADPRGEEAPADREGHEAAPSNERDPERRIMEINTVSDAALNRRYAETCLEPNGKLKRNLTGEARALSNIYGLMHDENVSGVFVKGSDNDIILPEPAAAIPDPHGGAARRFGPDELRLASIVRAEGEILICTFDNSKDGGRPILDSRGQSLEIGIPRADLVNAQLAAERATYEGLFEGDDKIVLAARIDALPQAGSKTPPPEIDSALENSANNIGLPTTSAIKGLVESIKANGTPNSEAVDKLLINLEGKTLLTKEDFHQLVDLLGGREAITQEVTRLRAVITENAKILETNPSDAMAQRVLNESKAQLTLLDEQDQIWAEAEAESKTPFDDYFEKAQNGELDAEKTEALMNALEKGDFTPILELFAKSRGIEMSDDDKAAWVDYAKKAGTGGLWVLAILLAIPAGIAYGMITTGIPSLAGSGGGRK